MIRCSFAAGKVEIRGRTRDKRRFQLVRRILTSAKYVNCYNLILFVPKIGTFSVLNWKKVRKTIVNYGGKLGSFRISLNRCHDLPIHI